MDYDPPNLRLPHYHLKSMKTPLTQLYSKEGFGNHGAFAIEINVGATRLPDLQQEKISFAAYEAVRLVESAIMEAVIAASPDAQARRKAERSEIISLFSEPVLVEEIPNGYCSEWCCKHLPWFVITTRIGRFKIGWRKRVILLDWSQTVGAKTSDELFKAEDVTKDTRMIHAWSLEDAAKYIAAITESVK